MDYRKIFSRRILVIVFLFCGLLLPQKALGASSHLLYQSNNGQYCLQYLCDETYAYLVMQQTDGYDSTMISYKFGDNTAPYNSLVVGHTPFGSNGSGGYVPSPKSTLIASGLQPNRTYSLYVYEYKNYFGYMDAVFTVWSNKYVSFTTEVRAVTNPTYTNIGATSVTVNWTKGDNYEQPSVRLYKRIQSPVAKPWELVYTGTNNSATVENLVPSTKYEFYLKTYGILGEYGITDRVTGITSVMTSLDPAIAAAVAAQGAAEAAMAAGELAKNTSLETKTEVQNLQTSFNLFINTDLKAPTISEFVYSIPKATITSLDVANYSLVAFDESTLELQYRYKINNGAYTVWSPLTGDNINIALGSSIGIKKITAQVMDGGSNITTASATIFKI